MKEKCIQKEKLKKKKTRIIDEFVSYEIAGEDNIGNIYLEPVLVIIKDKEN